jgi:hypothetical protein
MYWLLLLFNFASAWTFQFTESACNAGFFTETEFGIERFLKKPGMSCPSGGGIRIDSCNGATNQLGAVFQDVYNVNTSIEIQFSVPYPRPNNSMLFQIGSPALAVQIDYHPETSVNVTIFELNDFVLTYIQPSFIDRSGFCNKIQSNTILKLLTDSNYISIMDSMSVSSNRIYIMKIAILKVDGISQGIFYTTLSTVQDPSTIGIAFSLLNILQNPQANFYKKLFGTTNLYKIGCGDSISYQNPGYTFFKLSVTDNLNLILSNTSFLKVLKNVTVVDM